MASSIPIQKAPDPRATVTKVPTTQRIVAQAVRRGAGMGGVP